MIPTIGRRAALALGAATLATPAVAQAGFPNRPIRLVVPWLPGRAVRFSVRDYIW